MVHCVQYPFCMVANPGKELRIEVEGDIYERIPIKTHLITGKDAILDVVNTYAKPLLQAGDFLFISERVVAITQGRAIPIKDIVPSRLANFLVRFVHKSPYGIGLGSPWTMELAIREIGMFRILLATFGAALTKPLGIKGVFYHIGGRQIAAIDGPCSYTLPPYNEYATLAPLIPDDVARSLEKRIQYPVVIIDANDLGVDVLGISNEFISKTFTKEVFQDNPIGQSDEQTPLCIVRKVHSSQYTVPSI